ncbi:hypothetical protein SEA_REYNAULD_25 [Rhodococcus phage Reynauld]|uniref:Uncharacterized protein n=1 Tax=Rhodococcus phage Reynauld TaxID=3062845 RepID=A0ACD4UH66_9CAUD|nr:hypothetical protein SEA_REYNAULD_25 [Rhodococcus phage Reynauld]
MSILDDVVAFPNNVVALMVPTLQSIDPSVRVHTRPFRQLDSGVSISVYPLIRNPDDESMEMSGDGIAEPTINRYTISVEGLVVDKDGTRGNRRSSVLNTLLRHKLYRDQGLLQSLPELYVDLAGSREKFKRRGLSAQRYMNNEDKTSFVFLSTIEFWFETETITN